MAYMDISQVTYRVADQETNILTEVSFSVEKNDFLTLAGPSGGGKSTILKIMAGLISPTSGTTLFQGADISTMDPALYRRRVSYCFQQPVLFGETVKDNLSFSFEIRKEKFDPVRAESFLSRVDLPASYMDKKISQLSGGEKQRVALIRNLLFPPQVLLLDEVTTGLDEASKGIVHQLIDSVKKDGVTIVQVTHDAQELEEAERIIHIVEGRVEE